MLLALNGMASEGCAMHASVKKGDVHPDLHPDPSMLRGVALQIWTGGRQEVSRHRRTAHGSRVTACVHAIDRTHTHAPSDTHAHTLGHTRTYVCTSAQIAHHAEKQSCPCTTRAHPPTPFAVMSRRLGARRARRDSAWARAA
eukprot:4790341-Pleurochrysis_carterae.AAC.2